MRWRHLAAIVDVYDDILSFLNTYAPLERICSQLHCPASRSGYQYVPDLGTYWYPEDTDNKMRADRLLAVKTQDLTHSEGLLYHLGDMHLCRDSGSKDLVYACLALSVNNYGVQPDYSDDNSFENVLTELARGIISDHGNLDVLRLALLASQGKTRPGVPSWVPDWRQAAKVESCHVNKKYQAKTPNSYPLLRPPKSSSKDSVLRVRGLFRETLEAFVKTQYSQSIFRTSMGNKIPIVATPLLEMKFECCTGLKTSSYSDDTISVMTLLAKSWLGSAHYRKFMP
jgi:hypothetical protein